jgi:predicted restriction endonuclease
MKDKEVYQKTLELFDYQCAICGNNQVHLHHVRYGGLYGGRKTYMGNVIPLCKKHHDLVHTNKKKYMPILIDMVDRRINEQIF